MAINFFGNTIGQLTEPLIIFNNIIAPHWTNSVLDQWKLPHASESSPTSIVSTTTAKCFYDAIVEIVNTGGKSVLFSGPFGPVHSSQVHMDNCIHHTSS